MKRFLLPDGLPEYKANLHCHTTLSDGKLTPQQIKESYLNAGYSVVAFSDHDEFHTHNDLTDARFLAINSYESEIADRAEPSSHVRKVYHFCCFAKTDGVDYEEVLPIPDYRDKDAVNAYIQALRDKGFLVQYNHPVWSLQESEDLHGIKGLWGTEVYNFSATIDGTDGNQGFMYDVLLRDGSRLFCTATDDNHNAYPFGHEQCDSFGGYIVIRAERLDYPTIIGALERGDFYASTGPQIHDLYIEDGKIKVTCSPARHILFTDNTRRSKSVNAVGDDFVTYGEFELRDCFTFVRVQITGPDGSLAFSNAYWLD